MSGHDERPYATEPLRGTFRTPGGRNVNMLYRDGTNDWNTLSSCLTEDEYALRDLGDVRTVVDVGSYLGGVAVAIAVDHPEAHVWAVEPLPANVALIEENIRLNELESRVTVVAAAVDKPGVKHTTINWAFSDDESGRHHRFVGNNQLNKGSANHESAKVPAVDLRYLVNMAGGHVDFMKVDCEGGEYALFQEGASGVGEIRGEYHDGFARLRDLIPTHGVQQMGTDHFGGFVAVPL